MGKTYKAKTDTEYFEDLFGDDLEVDFDFDDGEELFSHKRASGSRKRGRGTRQFSRLDFGSDSHRLPSDWQDFDYMPTSHPGDDWR